MASLIVLAGGRFWIERSPDVPKGVPSAASTVVTPQPRPSRTVSESALAGLGFVDVTAAVGLDKFKARGGGQPYALPSMTAGLALTRIDGRLTVLATSPSGPVGVYQLGGGEFRDITSRLGLQGAGVATAAAFADLDGDGDQDLLLGRRHNRVVSVLRNESGRYVDVTAQVGVKATTNARNVGDKPDTRGLALADVNRDGYLDFLVGDLNGSMFGGAVYSAAGGGDRAACDFHDQLQKLTGPDVRHISQTRLYLGSAGGTFVDATKAWQLDVDTSLVATPQFADLNADGWPDLVMAGPLCSNRVLLNEESDGIRRFVEVQSSGAEDIPQGYGSTVRDFDGDQIPDWLITGIAYPTGKATCPAGNPLTSCAGNALLLGNGDGTFTPAEDADGLVDAGWAFGSSAEDFSNSGRRDVAITNGFTGVAGATNDEQAAGQGSVYFSHFAQDPLAFFVRDGRSGEGKGQYVDVAAQIGLKDTGTGRALAAVDYDGDGLLDLLVNNADTGLRLFHNTTSAGASGATSKHWLDVALKDPATPTNVNALGARIRLTTAAGAVTNDWLSANGSFETQNLAQAHFGLDQESGPVRVEVWWPGSATPRSYRIPAVDRRVVLTR